MAEPLSIAMGASKKLAMTGHLNTIPEFTGTLQTDER